MRAVVTCGPSYEPIDEVRRITNFSTGELGTVLCEELVRRGFETTCLRGAASTHALLPKGAEVVTFSTNDDLAIRLKGIAESGGAGVLFHTAALCDYRPTRVFSEAGEVSQTGKIPSRAGALELRLEPAPKILPLLREWFPQSRIVGWKYELNGSREDALAAARRQIEECRTDASVVNGRAFGEGFGLLHPTGELEHYPSKQTLASRLAAWSTKS